MLTPSSLHVQPRGSRRRDPLWRLENTGTKRYGSKPVEASQFKISSRIVCVHTATASGCLARTVGGNSGCLMRADEAPATDDGAGSARCDPSAVEIRPAQQIFEGLYAAVPSRREMLSAGTVEPGGQSFYRRRDRDATVGVAHQLRLAGLLRHGDGRLGQVGNAPDRVGEVAQAPPRTDLGIEVDEGDSPLAAEDHVVRTQVPVTDGLLIAAKRGCRGRVVEVPDQCRGAADSSVGEPVGGDARHLTVDEGQNLASAVVVAERTGSAVEADIGQVLQERVNVARSMVSRPAGGASHPDEPFCLHPAHKHVLDRLFHPTTIARPAASEQHPHIKLRRHAELPDRRHVG